MILLQQKFHCLSKSVDPYQMLLSVASEVDLHGLPMFLLGDARNQRALSQENLSSGFQTRVDSVQPAQPQKLGRFGCVEA